MRLRFLSKEAAEFVCQHNPVFSMTYFIYDFVQEAILQLEAREDS